MMVRLIRPAVKQTVPDVNLTANDFAVAAGTEAIDETAFKKLCRSGSKIQMMAPAEENVTIDVEEGILQC